MSELTPDEVRAIRVAAFIEAFGEPKTERDRRTLAAFLEGLEAAKPRAARQSAMAGARRRRFKRTKKEE